MPYPNNVCYMLHPCRLLWLEVGHNNEVYNFKFPRGLRRRFAAASLLELRVRIPPAFWSSVSCECCVLSGRRLCENSIALPVYRVWWGTTVTVCNYKKSYERSDGERTKQLRLSTNYVTPHVIFSILLCYFTPARALLYCTVPSS
jgi:hypothetical protein